jgi:hypothetical protein
MSFPPVQSSFNPFTCHQVLFAVYAFLSKGSVPLKALMLLEQSVTTLTYQVQDMFRDGKSIAGWLQTLRQVYDAVNIENKIVDGTVPYPRPGSDPEIGMKIEFKSVFISLATQTPEKFATESLTRGG